MTEVNNLSGQLSGTQARKWRSDFLTRISSFSEEYLPTAQVAERPHYLSCGLTDAGVIEVSRGRLLALTDDLRLYISLQTEGIDAINFNHLRTSNWVW